MPSAGIFNQPVFLFSDSRGAMPAPADLSEKTGDPARGVGDI